MPPLLYFQTKYEFPSNHRSVWRAALWLNQVYVWVVEHPRPMVLGPTQEGELTLKFSLWPCMLMCELVRLVRGETVVNGCLCARTRVHGA